MKKVTYSHARQHLSTLLDNVVDDAEAVCITRKNGKEIVMVDAHEYASLRETAYIFSTHANTEHFLAALEEMKNGEGRKIDLRDYLAPKG